MGNWLQIISSSSVFITMPFNHRATFWKNLKRRVMALTITEKEHICKSSKHRVDETHVYAAGISQTRAQWTTAPYQLSSGFRLRQQFTLWSWSDLLQISCCMAKAKHEKVKTKINPVNKTSKSHPLSSKADNTQMAENFAEMVVGINAEVLHLSNLQYLGIKGERKCYF